MLISLVFFLVVLFYWSRPILSLLMDIFLSHEEHSLWDLSQLHPSLVTKVGSWIKPKESWLCGLLCCKQMTEASGIWALWRISQETTFLCPDGESVTPAVLTTVVYSSLPTGRMRPVGGYPESRHGKERWVPTTALSCCTNCGANQLRSLSQWASNCITSH